MINVRTKALCKILVAAALAAGFAAPAFASPAVTVAPSAMHRAPNMNSRVVQEIPPNAQIDVQNCTGDWCYGSWRHLFGYIPAFAVGQGPPPPGLAATPPVVVAPAPVVVAPAWGWGGPYVGVGYGWGWRNW